jgi:hypothetical protein
MEEILNILYQFLFVAPEGVTMGLGGMAIAGIVSGGLNLLTSGIGMFGANKRARRAASEKARMQTQLEILESNRQEIIDPYAGVEDLSGMIKNPYDQLSVATQAAEMQAEEADIALANTLDTLRATGASAGGATALAQAALRSKKGVAATIEKQEADNERLKAQGEAQQQQLQLQEQQRLQQADILGKEFVYGQQEQRDNQKLNRLQAQITGQQQMEANYRNQSAALTPGLMNSVTGLTNTLGQAGVFGQ